MASSASSIMHRQTCALHDNEGTKTCSATLKKGGKCVNKATAPLVPRMMPTCKIHAGQRKVSGWCQAPLPCGFDCSRMLEWKPHGFQLCPLHREHGMICYFFKIPTEIRLRIYRFLLPDKPIRVDRSIPETLQTIVKGYIRRSSVSIIRSMMKLQISYMAPGPSPSNS